MKMQIKTLQRQQLLTHRSNLNQDLKTILDNMIRANLESMKVFQNAKVVHTFWSYGSEIDTHWLLELNKKIIVPKVLDKHTMQHCLVNPTTVFELQNKIDEPSENYEILEDLKRIDIVIVPLLGFDNDLNRIGYGGGYYDRFLSQLKEINPKVVTIGIAYEFQSLSKVNVESHDIALDYVVTEAKINHRHQNP
jgi:5-formyltetrahydrofolate cyclo-ligase